MRFSLAQRREKGMFWNLCFQVFDQGAHSSHCSILDSVLIDQVTVPGVSYSS